MHLHMELRKRGTSIRGDKVRKEWPGLWLSGRAQGSARINSALS